MLLLLLLLLLYPSSELPSLLHYELSLELRFGYGLMREAISYGDYWSIVTLMLAIFILYNIITILKLQLLI